MDDNDPYQPRDSRDPYDRRPDPDDYSIPDEPAGQAPDQAPGPEYELQHDPAPVPRPAAAPPSYVSVPCTYCGYNLTGVAIGGGCPECGAQVDASLYAASSAPANGMAITSMVIGIISVCGLCCCPTGFLGIIGLIFGIVANNQISTGSYNNASKGMATAGLICSGIGIVLAIVWVAMVALG